MGIIYTGDSLQVIREIEDNSVDLIITSPPYDGANTPKDKAPNLLRFGLDVAAVLKPGGVCVLVLQDLIHKGVKSCNCLRIPVYWHDYTDLKLWDDFIYWRGGIEGYWWKRRIRKDHDYMWVLVKGNRPKTFNKQRHPKQGSIFDYRAEKRSTNRRHRKKDKDKMYPVPFPLQLANDMIQIFSEKGDIVLDPFCGYGTVLMAAKLLEREWIGIELLPHIAKIARDSLQQGIL